MKLGKNEKLILKTLSIEKEISDSIIGYTNYTKIVRNKRGKFIDDTKIIQKFNTTKEIAIFIYGEDAKDFFGNLKSTIRASLSRTIRNMYRKGLIQKGKITNHMIWDKENNCMTSKLKCLHIFEYDKSGYEIVDNFTPLTLTPYRVKFIWILTEKGKEIVSNLTF